MRDEIVSREIRTFIEELKKQGFERVKISLKLCETQCCHVQEQKVSYCGYGRTADYFAEALWKGEYCSICADSLREIPELAERLKESAGVLPESLAPEMIAESRDLRGRRFRKIEESELADALKCAEREALACEKVDCVEICSCYQYEDTMILVDEELHYLADDNGDCTVSVRAVARDGGSVAAAAEHGIVNPADMGNLLKRACAYGARAGKYARFGLHGTVLPSGTYPVVIENCVMAELLGQYLPIFYADNVRQKKSVLAGKEKERLASEFLVLEEDPFCREGTCRRRIDDEGTPVSRKALVAGGRLASLLYNKKSAWKEEKESTGNGFKPEASGSTGTGATNIILSWTGETVSRREMIRSTEGGIYLTRLEGLFAGADVETGDFSLLASGNRIENGKVSGAVNRFTISGNILELWRSVEQAGDDLDYCAAGGACVLSPTVKVAEVVVSGR